MISALIGTHRTQVCELLGQGFLVPLIVELPAQGHQALSLYRHLDGSQHGFLLEGFGMREEPRGAATVRRALLGLKVRCVFRLQQGVVWGCLPSGKPVALPKDDPFGAARCLLTHYKVAPSPSLLVSPGLVGYFSYEVARAYENVQAPPKPSLEVPDALLLLASSAVVLEPQRDRLQLVVLAGTAGPGVDVEEQWEEAFQELCRLHDKVTAVLDKTPARQEGRESIPQVSPSVSPPVLPLEVAPDTSARFVGAVRRVLHHIADGEVFQAVVSHRQEYRTEADGLSLYAALDESNPSAYSFYLRHDQLEVIGASPETLVRTVGQQAWTHPIAGTRRRGMTPQEDARLALALAEDPKERAEHLMLVDLARNDLGKVCQPGSIHVDPFMQTERFSHVYHLVSRVVGTLTAGQDGFSLLQACLPAGTLSGAPKLRAMSIVDEVEPVRRGIYGGALGFFGLDGTLDTCIIIRTMVKLGSQLYLQAGAGIVADSLPESEYQETLTKLAVLFAAVRRAEEALRS